MIVEFLEAFSKLLADMTHASYFTTPLLRSLVHGPQGVIQTEAERRQGRRHGFPPVGTRSLIYIVHCVLAKFQWGQYHSFAPTASSQWGQAAPLPYGGAAHERRRREAGVKRSMEIRLKSCLWVW